MIKKFESFTDDNWIECPHEYEFSPGEEVKISPKSKYQNQVDGDKTGKILRPYSYYKHVRDKSWEVEWKSGIIGCHYWREDLLIRGVPEKQGKIKWYKDGKFTNENKSPFDPFGEEDWDDINYDDCQRVGREFSQLYGQYGFGDFDITFLNTYPNAQSFIDSIINYYREIFDKSPDGKNIDDLDDNDIPKAIIDSSSSNEILEELIEIRLLRHIDKNFNKIIIKLIYKLLNTEWNNLNVLFNNFLIAITYPFEEYFGIEESYGRKIINNDKFEINKFYRFDQFIRFDLLGLKKLNILRELLDDKFVVIEQHTKKFKYTRGRVFRITSLRLVDEVYYEVYLMVKGVEKSVIVSGEDKFKVQTNIKSKIDPLGEDEWN